MGPKRVAGSIELSQERNITLAEALIAGVRGGAESGELAKLFGRTLSFEIQGDDDALPWLGRRTGRAAAAEFFRNLRAATEVVRCKVEEILGSERRAVIIGELAFRLKETGRVFKSQFAVILTVDGGEIVRFQVLKDSFGLSRIVRE